MPPSSLASLSPVAHILIIWKQALHCTSHPLSHLISIPYQIPTSWPCWHHIASSVASFVICRNSFCYRLSRWLEPGSGTVIITLLSLSLLIWISPLDSQMSKLPQTLKLWSHGVQESWELCCSLVSSSVRVHKVNFYMDCAFDTFRLHLIGLSKAGPTCPVSFTGFFMFLSVTSRSTIKMRHTGL